MGQALSTHPAAPPTGAATANEAWVRALGLAAAIDDHPERTFPDVIDGLAWRFGDAPALLSDRECFSFRELAERSNRYSRWALRQGLRPGDRVVLLMSNRPEYLAVWIGLSRVGVVVALLNTHLTGFGLAHCVGAAAPVHAIVEAALLQAWQPVAALLDHPPTLWAYGSGGAEHARLDLDLADLDGAPLRPCERPGVTTATRALLIYTSGTTGLPKAAHVSHHRVMMWSHWFAGMLATTPADRMYDCLPLYHSVGGVVATGAALVNGGSVVIAAGFSARHFFDEVIRWDCTLVQYIGELCRYLLRTPPAPADTAHRLRFACGNGLRAEVWDSFKARFAIPRVLEFYAATEGNFSLYNVDGKAGSIGRIPPFMATRFPAALVRHDPATEAPARGADGLCIRCARDEVGEAIGRVSTGDARAGRFEGYTTEGDTAKKLLHDVFAPGDTWFRTGDLMRLDRQGYFTFVDRLGDTFRWKGENVATTEVEAVVTACPGVIEALVYGVAVPGEDGKAGMAALMVDTGFDPTLLHRFVTDGLPAYARPVFLRLCPRFEVTETFKQKKGALARDGFDPDRVSDPLLVLDAARDTYVPLRGAEFARIVAGSPLRGSTFASPVPIR